MDAAVVDFLHKHNQVFLLTRRADGWPTGYPMVGNYRDGAIEFNTYRASAKVSRVLRDGRASCLAVPREDRGTLPSLWVRGAATLVTDTGDLATTLVTRPSPTTSALVVPRDVVDNVARSLDDGKRCLLRVEVTEFLWVGESPSGA